MRNDVCPKPPGDKSAAAMASALRDTDAAIDTVKALSHEIQIHAHAVVELTQECERIREKIRSVDERVYPPDWGKADLP
jgi:hypothetical protein